MRLAVLVGTVLLASACRVEPAATPAAQADHSMAPRPPGDPAKPVREGYRIERRMLAAEVNQVDPPWVKGNRERIFSRRMVAAFEDADRAFARDQELRFDADPFIAAQDHDDEALRDLKIEVVSAAGAQAVVRATFTNIAPTTVSFEVVHEDGRWVIDDIDGLAAQLGAR